jgi:NAD(P)-dependent dehydrogenase (short-subunit alcohol dehydrogenase family)/acyl carrier protein
LETQGQRYLLVYADAVERSEVPGIWRLNPAHPEAFERLFREAVVTSELPLRGVVHLWSLEATPPNALTLPALEQAQIQGCGSVLHLVQTLVGMTGPMSPRLWLVTRGAVPAGHSPAPLAVAQASLWGLGKVLALEHPEMWGGLLDLAPDTANDDAVTLLTEMWDAEGEDQVAFRDGRRYVARLVQSGQPGLQGTSLRSDCSYLITGGLGALGLQVARGLVEQGARYLVLAGRSGVSSQTAQAAVNALERMGAKVLVIRADVSHPEDVSGVLRAVQASMPPLRGLVHTAGVLEDGVLLSQNWQQFTRVMAAKVTGTWLLHTLTQDLALDFFVCFSSVTAMLGSPGQGNYAAANAFMDAVAQYRRSRGLAGLSINWGPWAETGVAAALDSRVRRRMAEHGLDSIAPEHGIQVLAQLMSGQQTQIGVLSVNWEAWALHFGDKFPLLRDVLKNVRAAGQLTAEKAPELLQKLEAAPAEVRLELLLTHVQGEVAHVLGLDVAQPPDVYTGFSDMGMDSLMAVELKNRLQAALGIPLTSTLAFNYPTIEELVEYLSEKVLALNKSVQLHQDKLEDQSHTKKVSTTTIENIKQFSDDELIGKISERFEDRWKGY